MKNASWGLNTFELTNIESDFRIDYLKQTDYLN